MNEQSVRVVGGDEAGQGTVEQPKLAGTPRKQKKRVHWWDDSVKATKTMKVKKLSKARDGAAEEGRVLVVPNVYVGDARRRALDVPVQKRKVGECEDDDDDEDDENDDVLKATGVGKGRVISAQVRVLVGRPQHDALPSNHLRESVVLPKKEGVRGARARRRRRRRTTTTTMTRPGARLPTGRTMIS